MFIVRATWVVATGVLNACYSPELLPDPAASAGPGGGDESSANGAVTTSPNADSTSSEYPGTSADATTTATVTSTSTSGPSTLAASVSEASAASTMGTSGIESNTGDTSGDSSAGSDTEGGKPCEAIVVPAGPSCGAIPMAPTVLASFSGVPEPIAVDDEYVYFAVDGFTNRIHRVSKCGGATLLLADAGSDPAHMVLDEDSVYWTDYGVNGSVFKVPKTGGKRVPLAVGLSSPLSLRADGERVCWSSPYVPEIRCALASGGGNDITVVETAPYAVLDFRSFGDCYYWTSHFKPGAVGRVEKTGGGLAVLLEVQDPGFLMVDCEHIYFTRFGPLERMPLAGGPTEPFAESVYQIAQDDETVFWTDPEGGRVRSRSKLGGPVKEIAGGLGSPYQIAIDATHVYWTDLTTNAVMVAPR